ncbi:MAG: translation initiation factor IF-2 N-terminal domain-containing protein, partial [Planctomycetia bacterium]|nr:translation initiation factor IF-2 N-terminal domain-containing protein [Planctomycetia bacterium]
MSIRVYALAKELKVDNKFIMDLCSTIGIPTKGSSALASISDEDAVRVKEYLKKGNSPSAKVSQDPEIRTPLEPPKNIVMGRVPTLPSKPRRTEKKEPVKV